MSEGFNRIFLKLGNMLKTSINVITNLLLFFFRLIYTLILHSLYIIVLLSFFLFGLLIFSLPILFTYDFFFTPDGEKNQAVEAISSISFKLMELLGDISYYLGKLIQFVLTNKIGQFIVFFSVLILITKEFVNSGWKGYVRILERVYLDMQERNKWVFKPINVQFYKETKYWEKIEEKSEEE